MMVTFEVFLNIFLSKNVPVRTLTRETTGIYPSANTGSRRSVSEPLVCVELLLRLLVSLTANAIICIYVYMYMFSLWHITHTHITSS